MHVRLHNVGPIRKAEVTLHPLTVLVGPNGSGKTTISTVLYAALLAHKDARRRAGIGVLRRATRLEDPKDVSLLVDRVVDNWEDEYRDAFEKHLRRCCARDLDLLAREGRSGKGAAPRIVVGNTSRASARWQLVFRLQKDGVVLERKHKDYLRPRPPSARGIGRIVAYENQVRRILVGGMPSRPVYFPAARSGFMQMHNALAALLFGALGAGYFDHATIGAIPGTAADFLQFLATLDVDGESDVPEDAVDRLEQSTLHGTILMDEEQGARGVRFQPNGLTQSWPIASAATSAAELAPLLLYLRYHASSGDALFIDEPEAHFHPASQIAIAGSLLEIARSLGGVVLATHSEFVVSGLSNALMSTTPSVPPTPSGEAQPPVGLYEFRPDPDARRGAEVVRMEIDPSRGFDVRQFSQVADAAYEQAVDLYNSIHAIVPKDGSLAE